MQKEKIKRLALASLPNDVTKDTIKGVALQSIKAIKQGAKGEQIPLVKFKTNLINSMIKSNPNIGAKRIAFILLGLDILFNSICVSILIGLFYKMNISKILNPIVFKVCEIANEKIMNGSKTKLIDAAKNSNEYSHISAYTLAAGITASITEESSKIVAINFKCSKEYTVIFNAFEFLSYVAQGQSIAGRLVGVAMHVFNTFLHDKGNHWLAVFIHFAFNTFLSLALGLVLFPNKDVEKVLLHQDEEKLDLMKIWEKVKREKSNNSSNNSNDKKYFKVDENTSQSEFDKIMNDPDSTFRL